MYIEIANDSVLMVGLYTDRNQKLAFLHLFTDLFCKDVFSLFKIKQLIEKSACYYKTDVLYRSIAAMLCQLWKSC